MKPFFGGKDKFVCGDGSWWVMSELLLWEYVRENFLRINQLYFLKSSGCWVEQTMLNYAWYLHLWNYQISDSDFRWRTNHTLRDGVSTVGDSEPFIQAWVSTACHFDLRVSGFPFSNVPHLPMMSGTDKLKPPLAIVTNEISWDFKCNMLLRINNTSSKWFMYIC